MLAYIVHMDVLTHILYISTNMLVRAIEVLKGHYQEDLVISHVIGRPSMFEDGAISYLSMVLLCLKTFVPFVHY